MLNETGKLLESILRDSPRPIAWAFSELELHKNAVERLTYLVKTAERLTRYLTLVQLARHIDLRDDEKPDLELELLLPVLRKPSFGAMLSCLRGIAKRNRDVGECPLARELFRPVEQSSVWPLLSLAKYAGKDLPPPHVVIEAFVQKRNEVAHGENLDELAARYNEPLLAALHGVVLSLPRSLDAEPRCVHSIRIVGGDARVSYRRLVGTERPRLFELDMPLARAGELVSGEIYLWSDSDVPALRISPLLLFDSAKEEVHQLAGMVRNVPCYRNEKGMDNPASKEVTEDLEGAASFLFDSDRPSGARDTEHDHANVYTRLVEWLVRDGEADNLPWDVLDNVRDEIGLPFDVASAIHAEFNVLSPDSGASKREEPSARTFPSGDGSSSTDNDVFDSTRGSTDNQPTHAETERDALTARDISPSLQTTSTREEALSDRRSSATSAPMLEAVKLLRSRPGLYIPIAVLSVLALSSMSVVLFCVGARAGESQSVAGIVSPTLVVASEEAGAQAILNRWVPFTHNGRRYLSQAHEATNHQYSACRSANRCRASGLPASLSSNRVLPHFCTPSHGGSAVRPVNCISPQVAQQLCAYIGANDQSIARPARVPTYSEWLAATQWTARSRQITPCQANFCDEGYVNNVSARGGQPCFGRRTPVACNDRWGGTSTIGVFPGDLDKRGMADVLGNVSEIVVEPDGGYSAAGYNFRFAPGPRDGALIRRGFPATDSGVQYGVRCIVEVAGE